MRQDKVPILTACRRKDHSYRFVRALKTLAKELSKDAPSVFDCKNGKPDCGEKDGMRFDNISMVHSVSMKYDDRPSQRFLDSNLSVEYVYDLIYGLENVEESDSIGVLLYLS